MADPRPNLTREDIANLEVGATDISPRLSRVLSAFFALFLAVIPLVQQALDLRPDSAGQTRSQLGRLVTLPSAESNLRGWAGVLAANRRILTHVQEWESETDDRSFLKSLFLGPLQSLFCRVGLGNEKAYLGKDGWLYFRPDVDLLTGKPFDPAPSVRAITDFQTQLAARGVSLVVLPVPSKAGVVSGPLGARHDRGGEALHNPSFARWRADLEAAGVPVFDPSTVLTSPETGPESAFLRTDTHWTPMAMQRVVEELARFLTARNLLPGPEPVAGYNRSPARVENRGDIAVMLHPPRGLEQHPRESVTVHPVRDIQGVAWKNTPSASVLLLGDSFANIFSEPGMKWGAGAGLAEQLSFVLQRPLDAILLNDNGSHATREILSQQLAAGVDRLKDKKVVIWEFAARELSFGDWRPLPMSLGTPEPVSDEFWTPPAGAPVRVRARVVRASPVPKPGSVAYSEHIRMVLLADLHDPEKRPLAPQALAYARSMTGHQWTAAGAWKPGDVVTVDVQPWSAVESRFGALNRSELTDDAFLLAEPVWVEPVAGETAARAPRVALPLGGLVALGLLALVRFVQADRTGRRA